MNRRAEMAYKAEPSCKSAQHEKTLDSEYGKCCDCIAKVHVLIRGDLFEELSRANMDALCVATAECKRKINT